MKCQGFMCRNEVKDVTRLCWECLEWQNEVQYDLMMEAKEKGENNDIS